MTKEIAVAGAPTFTTGFRLAGVRRFEEVPEENKPTELEDSVEGLLEDESVGIIIMHQDDLDHLSETTRKRVETTVEPAVVTLGGEVGTGGLREQIKRAIGIDLYEED